MTVVPVRTPYRIAASSTVRVIGPTWSSDVLSGTTPSAGTSPDAGLRPTTPQAAAGMRIDPPVSVPIEARPMPSATATAEPPLDPPGDRAGSIGWWTAPNAESSLVVPSANSWRLVLPDHDRAGLPQPGDDGGVGGDEAIVEHARGRGGHLAAHVDQILQRDRHAVQRSAVETLAPLVIGDDAPPTARRRRRW